MNKARKWTDNRIDGLKIEIEKIYDSEVYGDELDDYFCNLVEEDEKKRKQVAEKIITMDYYISWRVSLAGTKECKNLIDKIANKYTEINEYSVTWLSNEMKTVYLKNHAMETRIIKRDEKIVDGISISPKNTDWKQLNEEKDKQWNKRIILAKILQYLYTTGTLLELSKYVMKGTTERIINSMIRHMVTMTTAAENKAKFDIYTEMSKNGVKVRKIWRTMGDERVRASHEAIDGIVVDIDEQFPNGLMYPGDPTGSPEEVMNCRCMLDYELR